VNLAIVFPNRKVVVTDLDTRFLESSLRDLKNVEVLRHDVVNDPLPRDSFDLIHARLVFEHIPERDKAISGLVSALRKNGWLFLEDFDDRLAGEIAIGDKETIAVLQTFLRALHEVFKRHGKQAEFGVRLPGILYELGLTEIGMETSSILWFGGKPGCIMMKANFEQMSKEIVDLGLISKNTFEEGLKIFDKPGWGFSSPRMISVWGSKH
jgi:SAM-dependent methyltransferase